MKICTYILFILLINTLSVNAQPFVNPSIKPNTAFMAGEKLTYQIRYGIIVGGITTLSLTNEIYENKEVFHAVATGKTTGMAEVIYGVNDVYESWFDKETNLSYKQIRNIKEGSYTKYNEVTYNRKNNTVNSKLSGVHSVPEKILDLTTMLYYIRRIDFSKVKENEVIFMNIYFSDKIFPFYMRYKGKETIRTKYGKISCLKILPVVEVGRMFKTPNDVSIWITDDGNYLPAMIEMDIRIVGKIHLKLISYENIVHPLIIQ
ncbi:MAG: DUF3108 domain-containing protein [Bacteroidota bacterium]|nr:DUF3108 domain-containing protein [Bacteroidota bacterium]